MNRKKIIVRKGNAYVPVDIHSIALFLSSQKLTFAIDFIGNKYLVDKSLSDLEDSIDPYAFFRVNRQSIINIEAIKEFKVKEYGRLSIKLLPQKELDGELHVSHFTAPLFKKWLEKI